MKFTHTHSKLCCKHVCQENLTWNIFSSVSNFYFFSLLLAPVNGSFNATDIKGTLTERTDSSEETTEVVEQMVMKITDKAAKSLENTTSTKDEALALEQEIKEALNSTHSKQGLIFLVQYVVVNLGCHDIQYSKLQQLSFCCRQKLLLLYGYIYSIAYLQEKKNLSACKKVPHFHIFTKIYFSKELSPPNCKISKV